MEPENVINSESLQLENDRSQVASLHLWNRRLLQFLIRVLYTREKISSIIHEEKCM